MDHIYQIYDRIAKRCISLSSRCTINLINGLYGTDYPTDSKVTYNWTENTDDELKRTLADMIVTINHCYSYHIEFQMTKDGDIILRMFEYGFHHAINNREDNTLHFPEPVIVYLYNKEKLPDEYILKIRFGTQGEFLYKAPVYKYLEKTLDELNAKKLIVLIPFQLLRLRQAIEKERTPENMDALKKLITHDILDSLNKNVIAGNITAIESIKLGRMIFELYKHIYGNYDELIEEGVNQMAEEALIFDIDILDYQLRKIEKRMELVEAQKQTLELENQTLESQNQTLESQNQTLESQNQTLESQNQTLESQNRSLHSEVQIWKMHARGSSVYEIAKITGLSAEKVAEILETD